MVGQVAKSVCFGNGIFIIVGQNGKIWRSTDLGLTFTEVVHATGTAIYYAVSYGNGRFIAIGQSGQEAYSDNLGVSWTGVTIPGGLTWISICYQSAVWVIGTSGGALRRSTDYGVTWGSNLTVPALGGQASAISCGGGVFIVGSSVGKIARSTDLGLTWGSLITNSFDPNPIRTMSFGNGIFVCFGDNSYIQKSTDLGVTWSALIPVSSTSHIYGSCYANGKFLAFGAGARTLISNQIAELDISYLPIKTTVSTGDYLKMYCALDNKECRILLSDLKTYFTT